GQGPRLVINTRRDLQDHQTAGQVSLLGQVNAPEGAMPELGEQPKTQQLRTDLRQSGRRLCQMMTCLRFGTMEVHKELDLLGGPVHRALYGTFPATHLEIRAGP